MKTIICVLAGLTMLSSFRPGSDEEKIDGIWLGYYRSDMVKEKMLIKFNARDQIEFYTGGVDQDATRSNGSYTITGDSISFNYTTPDGQQFAMQGHVSLRKNYVDGVWKANGSKGSFFIEKQDVEERVVQP